MQKRMKAGVKTRDMEPGAERRDALIPRIGSGNVPVKVEKVALCESDRYRYYWESSKVTLNLISSLIIGQKLSGRVVKVGAQDKQTKA